MTFKEYILETERFNSEEIPDDHDNHEENVDDVFEKIENYFMDNVIEKISYYGHPSMDYGFMGDDENINNMYIMVDGIDLAYDVNINHDIPVEQQIKNVHDKVDALLKNLNIDKFATFDVRYQRDNKFDEYEASATRNEWIAITLEFGDIHLKLHDFKRFCDLLIDLDKQLKSLENYTT